MTSEWLYKKDIDLEKLDAEYTQDDNPSWMTNKYSAEISETVIAEIDAHVPKQLSTKLLQYAKEAEYRYYYKLLHLAKADSEVLPEVAEIEEWFSFLKPHIFGTTFHKMIPGQIIKPHIDPIRTSAIYLPLYTSKDIYPPLEIYYNNRVYGVTKQDNQSFYLWNPKLLHGAYNHSNETNRYNFQILVNLPYSSCLDLIKNNMGIRYRKDAFLTYDTKAYFSQFVEEWSGKDILDWGCGKGNFLSHSEGVDFNYTGCDVNADFIENLSTNYPEHTFILSEQHNKQYASQNTDETINCLKGKQFDIILAFSVFTHMDLEESKKTMNELKSLLKPGGKILFTIFTNDNKSAWEEIIGYRYEYFDAKHLAWWEQISSNDSTYISIDQDNSPFIEINKDVSSVRSSDYFLSFYEASLVETQLQAKMLPAQTVFDSKIMNFQSCFVVNK